MLRLGAVTEELFLDIMSLNNGRNRSNLPGHDEMNIVCHIVDMYGDTPDRFILHIHNTDEFFNSIHIHGNTGVAFQPRAVDQYKW